MPSAEVELHTTSVAEFVSSRVFVQLQQVENLVRGEEKSDSLKFAASQKHLGLAKSIFSLHNRTSERGEKIIV